MAGGGKDSSQGIDDDAGRGYLRRLIQVWRENPLPIWAGLAVIGLLQYRQGDWRVKSAKWYFWKIQTWIL